MAWKIAEGSRNARQSEAVVSFLPAYSIYFFRLFLLRSDSSCRPNALAAPSTSGYRRAYPSSSPTSILFFEIGVAGALFYTAQRHPVREAFSLHCIRYLTFPVSFALLLSWCYTVACQTKQPSWTLLSHSFVWATHDFQLLEHVDASVDHQEEQEEKAMENRPRFTFIGTK